MKGGMQYFSLVIMAITSFFGIFLLLLFIATLIFIVNPQIEGEVTGTMTYNFYEQTKAENMLLTYMDSTHEGKKMSDLLAWAVHFDRTKFSIDENEIDVADASEELMDKITSKNYKLTLKFNGKHTHLAGEMVGKGNTKAQALISANGNEGWLKLEVK